MKFSLYRCIWVLAGGGVVLSGFLATLISWQPEAHVSFLNVGPGDATFITTDEGHRILYDCGDTGSSTVKALYDKIHPLARRIDLMIVSHGDRDHYGGCFEVLEHFEVDKVMINGTRKEEDSLYEEFLHTADQDAELIPGFRGTEIDLGSRSIQVLHPSSQNWGEQRDKDNENSIVLHLQSDRQDIGLLGDASKATEQDIIKEFPDLEWDVFQVAHHGSDTSTSQDLLEGVQPEIGVISVSRNNQYGHPDEAVIQRLKKNEIQIHHTYEQKSLDFMW